ncbi:MAG TPA: glucose 1-dehydrogenase [Candidatus Acidoferrum sp.]|nr:glucose 1-dehydrogenase [Candidatus Acidoferrum sp.]
MRLKGKVALVTGGGSGLGQAISIKFSQEGAKVCVADLDAKRAQSTVTAIGENQAFPVVGDVSKSSDAEMIVKEALDHFKGLDILVNSAGFWLVDRPDRVDALSEQDWDRVVNVNLKGVFLCSKYALLHMLKQQHGAIINLASECGMGGMLNAAAYCAAKGGVVNLTRQMGLEYARKGIRVNCIIPCNIKTPMLERELDASENREMAIKRYHLLMPLGRFGESEEVANAAVFLASGESSFTTASVLMVDGGVTAGGTIAYSALVD